MSTINDGGPAFPTSADNGHSVNQDGMTLRDYFAAKALPAVIDYQNTGHEFNERVAEAAYAMADAMLRARGGAA